MNDGEIQISQGYLSEVAKRYSAAHDDINDKTESIPSTVDAGEASEPVDAIVTRLVEASTQLAGLCGTTAESLRLVVNSVDLEEQSIAEAFRKLEL